MTEDKHTAEKQFRTIGVDQEASNILTKFKRFMETPEMRAAVTSEVDEMFDRLKATFAACVIEQNPDADKSSITLTEREQALVKALLMVIKVDVLANLLVFQDRIGRSTPSLDELRTLARKEQ